MSSCGCSSIGPTSNQDPCCNAHKVCTTPAVITPDTVKAECIFVEKVYDAVLLKEEKTIFEEFTLPNFTAAVGSTFQNVKVICQTKPIPGISTGLSVTCSAVAINGITPPVFFTPIGPGGIEQTDLSFIDTSACDALGVGTKIIVQNRIEIKGQVVLIFSGTIITPNGVQSQFSVQTTLDIADFTVDKFAQLCMPSTYAAQKPSLAELCAANATFILPLGDNSLTVAGDGTVKVNGLMLFCIICEKKVKVPVQICVLATDFCQPEEIGGLCVDYPSLFPPQVDLQLR